MLRYRCLVLDHDDTTVDSTRAVNYPQFLEALARYRPELHISEEQFFRDSPEDFCYLDDAVAYKFRASCLYVSVCCS